jgi:hypothetical protein
MAMGSSVGQDHDLEKLIQYRMDISLDAGIVLGWVQDNFEPDEVYDNGELDAWAKDQGYEKPE